MDNSQTFNFLKTGDSSALVNSNVSAELMQEMSQCLSLSQFENRIYRVVVCIRS